MRDEAKIEQKRFDNRVQRLSFDRGFHSPGNQEQLSELVTQLCLPKPGAKQSVKQLADADDSEARWLLVIKLMALRVNSQSRPASA